MHQISGTHSAPKSLPAYASSNCSCDRVSCDASEIGIDEWKIRRGIGVAFKEDASMSPLELANLPPRALVNLMASPYQFAPTFSRSHLHSTPGYGSTIFT